MSSKTLEPKVIISDRCVICRHTFTKKHPKDNRCICEKCADKIWALIGGENANED